MIRDHSGRTVSKSIKIGNVLFFSDSMVTKSAFRSAAKRFSDTSGFDLMVIFYDGEVNNGKWHFEPHGKRLSNYYDGAVGKKIKKGETCSNQ